MSLIGSLLVLFGAFFCYLGALGITRMPDVFTRIQAGTKAATLGAMCILLGVGLQRPEWLPKLLVIILFIALTSPVGSSAIARAAKVIGLTPWRAAEDRNDPEAES